MNREIARLEEELAEREPAASHGDRAVPPPSPHRWNLRESGLYRFATDLAQQITPENAGQFLPAQMVRLRRLTARTANWQEPTDSVWMRILTRLGILDRLRLGQLEQGLRALALPACWFISGQGLQQRLDALLSLEVVYPLLMTSVRHLHEGGARSN